MIPGGAQFPNLRSLWQELPPTVTQPKHWRLHTAAELLFLVGFFAVVIFFGGGE